MGHDLSFALRGYCCWGSLGIDTISCNNCPPQYKRAKAAMGHGLSFASRGYCCWGSLGIDTI